MKRRFVYSAAAVAVSGLLLTACTSESTEEASSSAGGGGEAVAGCEDYAQYGTPGGSVEVYSTIQGVEADNLVLSWEKFAECTGIDV